MTARPDHLALFFEEFPYGSLTVEEGMRLLDVATPAAWRQQVYEARKAGLEVECVHVWRMKGVSHAGDFPVFTPEPSNKTLYRDRVLALRDQGLSFRQIAQRLGTNHTSVRDWVRAPKEQS